MPRIINNFNSILQTKSYLEYIIQGSTVVVCNFSALDTMHDIGLAKQFKHSNELNHALRAEKVAYARLSVSSPDKLSFRLPLTSLRHDARLRDTVLWFAKHIYKSFTVDMTAEFIRNDGKSHKLPVATPDFLQLAIYGVM